MRQNDIYFDWDAFRATAAKDAMCALIAQGKPIMVTEDGESYPSWNQRHFAENAIEYADSLIKQLREGKE